MKRLFFAFIVLIACICSCSGNSEEKALQSRFEKYLKAVSGKNNDSIKVYTYPKLFSILPDSQARESIERSYSIIRGIVELDSIKIDSIFPVIHIDNGWYAKAYYSAEMRMPADPAEADTEKFSFDHKEQSAKPTTTEHSIGSTYPAPRATLIATLTKGQYSVEVLSYQVKDRMRVMRVKVMTIAAKDEFSKEWSFFRVTHDDELTNKLFPMKVLEKITAKD